MSKEFLATLKAHWLQPHGTLAINLVAHASGPHAALAIRVVATLRAVFRHVDAFAEEEEKAEEAGGERAP